VRSPTENDMISENVTTQPHINPRTHFGKK
jgi:hypothetical protein